MSRLADTLRLNRFVIPRLREGRLCGLFVLLRLLSTPPHSDAVIFGFTCRDFT